MVESLRLQQHSTLLRQPREVVDMQRRKRSLRWRSCCKVARHSLFGEEASLRWLTGFVTLVSGLRLDANSPVGTVLRIFRKFCTSSTQEMNETRVKRFPANMSRSIQHRSIIWHKLLLSLVNVDMLTLNANPFPHLLKPSPFIHIPIIFT